MTCICPAGICKDPWAYLCVGPTEAATVYAIRLRSGFVMDHYGPHRQTAEQDLMGGDVLLSRAVDEIEWTEVPR